VPVESYLYTSNLLGTFQPAEPDLAQEEKFVRVHHFTRSPFSSISSCTSESPLSSAALLCAHWARCRMQNLSWHRKGSWFVSSLKKLTFWSWTVFFSIPLFICRVSCRLLSLSWHRNGSCCAAHLNDFLYLLILSSVFLVYLYVGWAAGCWVWAGAGEAAKAVSSKRAAGHTGMPGPSLSEIRVLLCNCDKSAFADACVMWCSMCRVGQHHTFIGIYGVHTVFLAGKSPYLRLYTVHIYGSGQPYACVMSVNEWKGFSQNCATQNIWVTTDRVWSIIVNMSLKHYYIIIL